MSDESPAAESGPSHRSVEIGVGLLTLVFGVVVLFGSLKVGIDWGVEGPKPGFFPFYVSLFIIGASLYNIAQAVMLNGIRQGLFSSWEQLRRVMTRDSLNELQARQRINAQLSTEEKVRRADYAIWTDGTHDNTRRQVVETLEQLARRGN